MIKWEEVSSFDVPKDVKLSIQDNIVSVSGKLGQVSRTLRDNYVRVRLESDKIKVETSKKNRRSHGITGTWESEIKSMLQGVTKGFEYEMKIDYTHFPTRVSVRGNTVLIENFLGERAPRIAKIKGNTKVSIKGDRVFLNGIDKRELGETASNIERATKIKGFDLRVFQDGIYLLTGGSQI